MFRLLTERAGLPATAPATATARGRARRAAIVLATLAAGAGASLAFTAAGASADSTASAPSTASTPTSPPPLTVLTGGSAQGAGDLFLTPTGDTNQYANGPEILSPSGQEIWFKPIPAADTAADFRTQRLNGQPVLTYWVGQGLGGLSNGTDYILNDQYQQIATVNAGNGLPTDGHEFLITPWNTALVLSYVPAIADLTSIGGPPNQLVIDGVVQEISIKTGRVLFQWNSADHVPYSESEQPLPASASTPWDWFHINAVHIGPRFTLLVDARNTWATYDINLGNGSVNWTLGGKASSFQLVAAPGQTLDQAGEIFAWQHDPEYLGNNTYTWFDNESTGTALFPESRTVTVKLDQNDWTATLVSSNDQSEGLAAPSQGNAQTLANGDQLVDWGALPYVSEFSSSGSLLFDADWPAGVNSYRAYLEPWNPQSTTSAAG
jgi:hypothetical protein